MDYKNILQELMLSHGYSNTLNEVEEFCRLTPDLQKASGFNINAFFKKSKKFDTVWLDMISAQWQKYTHEEKVMCVVNEWLLAVIWSHRAG